MIFCDSISFFSWQDILLSLASMFFAYSLIPQIFYSLKHKSVEIAWQTIIMTTFWIFVTSACNFSLNLTFAGVTNILVGLSWLSLGILKMICKKKKEICKNEKEN